jgi:acetyltransferase-like isoleucine patch superfamily enzyme
MIMRKVILILSILLPNPLKIVFYRYCMGWQIGAGVKIGLSYIDARDVVIGDAVRIGHFNVIRHLKVFAVGANTCIKNFNSFFGAAAQHPAWASCLEIGDSVNCMSHHFIDAGGKITIGHHSVLGGRESQIWSHGLCYDQSGTPSLQSFQVEIGSYVYIGARATLVGCSIPDQSAIGAGSVVTKKFGAEDCPILIAGNPAVIKKRYGEKSVSYTASSV